MDVGYILHVSVDWHENIIIMILALIFYDTELASVFFTKVIKLEINNNNGQK